MPAIQPSLWFDGNAEEAVRAYVELFPNSSVTRTSHYGPDSPGPEGEVMALDFVLDGRPFNAINGGPQFPFTEAVSFTIPCADQAEVDHYWFGLIADGGQEVQCGWLKDRFGLSWQVVPQALGELLGDPDEGRRNRAMQAMLGMKRLVVADLEAAADGA
ncbi:VOC family protein [Kineosporia sp. J2-2]|uniref:VOC family protein n=1 Tax=Kineosporia corallincola TaxID=2835133 RepID=A0ABS5TM03_9ACTN|nr:VOC family protein [Kineosporia corallincola]MBT0771878.1 VOC family protein [Kineosporia corallincola]